MKLSKIDTDVQSKKSIWILYVISVLCGGVLMAVEVVGGRLLSPYFGSSVYVWGSIISVFLIALSAGYYLGGVTADRKPSIVLLAGFIAVSGLLILLIPLLVSPLVKIAFNAGFGNYGALFVALLLFFLPSLGLGMVSPYVVKLGMKEADRLGNLVGMFYAISTFGSILGTFLTTFIFIPVFGVREIITASGTLLVLLSIIVLLTHRFLLAGTTVIFFLIANLTVTYFLSSGIAESYQGKEVLYSKETLYNNLAVVDNNQGYRFLMFNETQQTVMQKSAPAKHIWPYTRLMDYSVEKYKPDASKILLIGLGGGTIPKYSLANRNNVAFDAVDIDPEVIRVAEDYFNLPADSRLNKIAADGRMFLKGKEKQYDVIMVDAYNRLGIPFHLTTKEFFETIAQALKPGGIVIFNVVSSIEGEYSPFFKSMLYTITQVFPNYRLFESETTNPNKIDNLILVVSKNTLPPAEEMPVGKEYVSPIDLTDAVLLTDNYAPVEKLAVKILTGQ